MAPLLSTFGAASSRSFGMGAAGGDSYFITFVYSNTGNDTITRIELDRKGVVENSDGTIATLNMLTGGNNSRALLNFFNTKGELTQSKKLDDSLSNADTTSFGIVAQGSSFYSTIEQKDSNGKIHSILVKTNDSGAITWQTIEEASGGQHASKALAVSGTDLIQVGSSRNSGGSFDNGYISKYANSGSRTFIKMFKNGSSDYQVFAVDVDSSGNIFTGSQGYAFSGGGNISGEGQIAIDKFNSSGTHQAQATFGAPYSDFIKGTQVDSNDNVYVIWRSQGGGSFGNGHYLTKFNNSLAVQWTKFFGTGNTLNDIAIDSNDDILVTSYDNNCIFYKIDSSGNLVFARELAASSNIRARSINITANDDILLSGDTNAYGQSGIYVAKFRGDGTGLGTFGNYTYQNHTSLTLSSVTLTLGNTGFTTVSPSVSVVTSPSLTSSTVSTMLTTSVEI